MRVRITLLILATAFLSGCYVAPYPGYYGGGYGPRYGYYPHPHYYWWR